MHWSGSGLSPIVCWLISWWTTVTCLHLEQKVLSIDLPHSKQTGLVLPVKDQSLQHVALHTQCQPSGVALETFEVKHFKCYCSICTKYTQEQSLLQLLEQQKKKKRKKLLNEQLGWLRHFQCNAEANDWTDNMCNEIFRKERNLCH